MEKPGTAQIPSDCKIEKSPAATQAVAWGEENKWQGTASNSKPLSTDFVDKRAKLIHWKKDSPFNEWCWKNWLCTCRRVKLDPYLLPCTKLNSECIKDLNIKIEILDPQEEKIG